MKTKDKKHLYWIIGLVSITIILCGTLIWINYNSWTLRFEMDENTKEAIESIEWENLNQKECANEIKNCEYCWAQNETGWSAEDLK